MISLCPGCAHPPRNAEEGQLLLPERLLLPQVAGRHVRVPERLAAGHAEEDAAEDEAQPAPPAVEIRGDREERDRGWQPLCLGARQGLRGCDGVAWGRLAPPLQAWQQSLMLLP